MTFNSRRQRQEPVRNPAQISKEQPFRRSRTLTGSVSSKITAAVERASQLKSPRLAEHDLRSHRRRLGLLLSVVIVGAAGLAWLIDNTIAFIEPADRSQTNQAHLEVVESYFAGRPLERLPYVLDNARLTQYLQSRAPEVASVSVSGDDRFMKHAIRVTERIPVAKWVLGQDIYYVDAEGVAYQYPGSVSAVLVQVKDETGLPLASQRVASRSTMQFIGRVVSQIQTGGGHVSEVILPAGQLKEIDIILDNRPYRIKLHSDRTPEGQAADVLAAVRHLDSHSITPQYVDVRVEGKAFYR